MPTSNPNLSRRLLLGVATVVLLAAMTTPARAAADTDAATAGADTLAPPTPARVTAPVADANTLPPVNVSLSLGQNKTEGMSDVVKVLLFLSVLTLVPAILLTMTSFTRIVIVLSFVRRSLSVQQLPPNQIIIGLSLFLTLYIMAPILTKVNEVAIAPQARGQITETQALQAAVGPFRDFMLRQTRKKDLALFITTAGLPRPQTAADIPTHILLPAFALSEVKTAFQMGFIIFLPMLVIDMVVATLLTSMGMFMLPPTMVSVPLKILLFVLVDGWHLVIGSLAQSFA